MLSIDIIKSSKIGEDTEFPANEEKREEIIQHEIDNYTEKEDVEDDDEEAEENEEEEDFDSEFENLPNAHSLFDEFHSKQTEEVWRHMKENNDFDLSRWKTLLKSLEYNEYATIKLINFLRRKQKLGENTNKIWKIITELFDALSSDEYLVTQMESDRLLWDLSGAFGESDEDSDEDNVAKKKGCVEMELLKKNRNPYSGEAAAYIMRAGSNDSSDSSQVHSSTNVVPYSSCAYACHSNSDFFRSLACTSHSCFSSFSVSSFAESIPRSSSFFDNSTAQFSSSSTNFPSEEYRENIAGGATATMNCLHSSTEASNNNGANFSSAAPIKNYGKHLKSNTEDRLIEVSTSEINYKLSFPVIPEKSDGACLSQRSPNIQAVALATCEEEEGNVNSCNNCDDICSSCLEDKTQFQNEEETKFKRESQKIAEMSKCNPHENNNYEDDYFQGYSDLDIHRTMILDSIRTSAYFDFIQQNKHLFKDKVVLDVGCGSGILSFFCAKANAKKVIGIDAASDTVKIARQICKSNNFQNITFLCAKLEDVTLFQDLEKGIVMIRENEFPSEISSSLERFQCDIIISEWMGYCLLYESMLYTVIHARDKYLRKGGLLVPGYAVMQMCAADLSETISAHLDIWKRPMYGIDMSFLAYNEKTFLETPKICDVHSRNVISSFDPICLLNLYTIKPSDLASLNAPFSLDLSPPAKVKLRNVTSLVIYFDTIFSASPSVDELNAEVSGMRYFFNDKYSFARIGETFKMLESLILQEGSLYMSTKPFEDNKFATHWKQTVIHLLSSEKTRLLLTNEEERITGKLSISRHPTQLRHLVLALQLFEISCDPTQTSYVTESDELKLHEERLMSFTLVSNQCDQTRKKEIVKNLVACYELH